ncbi:aldose 1-epimerase [Evansella vedderi]|uniref:Aldose 1-epimerase n=1 Tax=Evansella vedderi TaxID=38282 RepID=A0ABT9ZZU6_9BACI|nr:aldose epimerase family protein [Evansella vedderi]MDQ0256774.1 aldose 1-epimerase [Evansella vedderi]
MQVSKEKFGELNGETITAFTLKNDAGFELTSIDYGCIITKMLVPDAKGTVENVVLGLDSIEEYEKYSPYFGATIGRVAGRIGGATFQLDGETYELPVNDGNNHLHGGHKGFDRVIWDTKVIEEKDYVGLEFTYFSPDGEEGYPGNLNVKVTYTLNNDNVFKIAYEGNSDKNTLLNLTNHTYFNLSGNLKRDILKHVLTMKSDRFIELNDELIPTGELLDVQDTVFDFRDGRVIQDGTTSTYKQNILAGQGYDHPFVLNSNHDREIVLEDRESGRNLVIETDEPCVVLYTGNQLTEDFEISGVKSKKYLGLCLETQKHPDAINQPNFPSIVLEKGKTYKSETTYSFNKNK